MTLFCERRKKKYKKSCIFSKRNAVDFSCKKKQILVLIREAKNEQKSRLKLQQKCGKKERERTCFLNFFLVLYRTMKRAKFLFDYAC